MEYFFSFKKNSNAVKFVDFEYEMENAKQATRYKTTKHFWISCIRLPAA